MTFVRRTTAQIWRLWNAPLTPVALVWVIVALSAFVLVTGMAGCGVLAAVVKLWEPGSKPPPHGDAPIVWPYYMAGAFCWLAAIATVGMSIYAPAHAQPKLTVALAVCGGLSYVAGYVLVWLWALVALAAITAVLLGFHVYRTRSSVKALSRRVAR